MLILKGVLNIIWKHANPPLMSGDEIKHNSSMYCYGSTDELEEMAEEIEEVFNISLPDIDWSVWGERSVAEFVAMIEDMRKKQSV